MTNWLAINDGQHTQLNSVA